MEKSNILYTTLILESKETSQNVKLIDVFVAFSLSCPVSSLPEERVLSIFSYYWSNDG